MIGFKNPPVKLILSVFFVSICFILLLYADSVVNKPLSEENVTISKTIDDPLMLIKIRACIKLKLEIVFQ